MVSLCAVLIQDICCCYMLQQRLSANKNATAAVLMFHMRYSDMFNLHCMHDDGYGVGTV